MRWSHAGFDLGRSGRRHHPGNAMMRALAPFVCIAQWRAGVLTPYADGSKLDFSEPLWRIDSSARAGHELETSLVLVNEQGALALLQAKHVLVPLILEELTMTSYPLRLGDNGTSADDL